MFKHLFTLLLASVVATSTSSASIVNLATAKGTGVYGPSTTISFNTTDVSGQSITVIATVTASVVGPNGPLTYGTPQVAVLDSVGLLGVGDSTVFGVGYDLVEIGRDAGQVEVLTIQFDRDILSFNSAIGLTFEPNEDATWSSPSSSGTYTNTSSLTQNANIFGSSGGFSLLAGQAISFSVNPLNTNNGPNVFGLGDLDLVFVPEPSSSLLLALGGLALSMRRRR